MKKLIPILLLFAFHINVLAQSPMTYEDRRGNIHLVGPISTNDLSQDTTYSKWYNKSYEAISLSGNATPWSANLMDVKVKIFLGTWCGDTKRDMPRFIRLWNDLGLDADQLELIALYNGKKTKQGPNGEEKGMGIHRVPTFIFERDGEEIARIVEDPVTDFETDLAQIALGYPSRASYAAANYMIKTIDKIGVEAMQEDKQTHMNAAWAVRSGPSELNSLGYVLLAADRLNEALFVFEFNSKMYKNEPNVFDSLGEALAIKGDIDNALLNYKKVLELDKKNKHAKKQLKILKKRKERFDKLRR